MEMQPLLFVGAAVLLLGGSGLALPPGTAGLQPAAFNGSSSHSLCYFYTFVSEPTQGLPEFIVMEYVDDHLLTDYDPSTKRVLPRAPWVEEEVKGDPQFWDTISTIIQNSEQLFRANLETLRKYYNQSRGCHTLQWMYGCELREDGSKGGHFQYGYDGRNYISFDKETLTWTAADAAAQITKRKLEDVQEGQRFTAYLEEECIEWLQRYHNYGKETLLRTEPPVGKVTRMAKATKDSQETLVCQAYGFYPKEINATWTKDREVWMLGTFRRNVAPNSDGTYHIWISIEVDPKERDRYRCYVDHANLPQLLVLAWEEPDVSVWLIVGPILAAVLLVATGIVVFIRKRPERAAS